MHLRRICDLCVVLVFLCLMPLALQGASLGTVVPQTAVAGPKRVLILYSFNNNTPTQQLIASGISEVIRSHNLRSADFVHEYLDIAPPKYPAHRAELAELLRQKYAGQQFDLIVAYSTEALNFLLNEGRALSPGSPCITMFSATGQPTGPSERKVTFIPTELDSRGTLELGLALFPNTRKVVVVVGVAAVDKVFESNVRRDFAPWQGQLEFDYTSQRPVAALMKEIGQLPPDTLVIFTNVASDITGKNFIPRDLVKTLAGISNAPVLSMLSTQIDTGVVGGSMVNMALVGEMIGHLMVALESGKPLALESTASFIKPMFNWTQIERWGADADRLPAHTVFVNRPLTLWGQYKAEVVTAGR